ncbi:tetratricopeptide repeat protein [Phormidesmis sp. 146-12]
MKPPALRIRFDKTVRFTHSPLAIASLTFLSLILTQVSSSQSQGAPPKPQASAALEQGFVSRSQGDAVNAYAAFEQAIRLSPNYAEAYVAKAGLLFKQGRSIEAIAAYDQALNLNPNLVAAYLGKGQALARQGKRNEARELLRSAEGTFQSKGDTQQAKIIRHLLPKL